MKNGLNFKEPKIKIKIQKNRRRTGTGSLNIITEWDLPSGNLEKKKKIF